MREKKIVSFDPSPEYSRIEEYYRDGLVFLRLYFLDDKQVKSEILITETP